MPLGPPDLGGNLCSYPAHLAASFDMTPEEQRAAISRIRLSIEGRKPPVQILLIEDNENDAALTTARLEQFGVCVSWARNSKEAEDFLVANDPWLVFLDLQLGPDDRGELGLNVLDLIRSFKPNTRIVILTGVFRHDSENCMKALGKGAVAVMLKPLTAEQVQLIFAAP